MPLDHGHDKQVEARRLRDKEWKIADIADELGVSNSTVTRWTNRESMVAARVYANSYNARNREGVIKRQRTYRRDRKKNPELFEKPRKRVSRIIEPD